MVALTLGGFVKEEKSIQEGQGIVTKQKESSELLRLEL